LSDERVVPAPPPVVGTRTDAGANRSLAVAPYVEAVLAAAVAA
jgi:hypothetical protein